MTTTTLILALILMSATASLSEALDRGDHDVGTGTVIATAGCLGALALLAVGALALVAAFVTHALLHWW